jgi:hypothetical protein
VPGDVGNFDDRQQGNSAILDSVTVVSDQAGIGAILRRLTGGLTAQLTTALATVR